MAAAVRREQAELSDTIFANSSGRPPAAIAVIRVSGPGAFAAGEALAGVLPPPRAAVLRTLRHDGQMLDSALILRFQGPASATGEDVLELHCHGGRAVVAAVEAALAAQPGLRVALPGEFTRRALENGRIDLMEAEGLADLLEAETEAQRVAAVAAAEGRLSARTREWLDELAALSAEVEALLDYAEEDDIPDDASAINPVIARMNVLRGIVEAAIASPSVERLREGVRVVIGGPPNAGKSTLLNLLAERDAAIVSPVSGTTRDRIEAAVVRGGLPLVLVDTAGLTESRDVVEAIGVVRATEAIHHADVVIWLGDDPPPRGDAIWVHARSDLPGREMSPPGRDLSISAGDPGSIERLWSHLATYAQALFVTMEDAPAMREHQRRTCQEIVDALTLTSADPLLVAEALAFSRRALARLLGVDGVDVMLDSLFSRFCVGK